ncbi:hypothetical protein BHE97_11475 [Aeromicrobium sp. PE09-221]|uniref:RCC1 domain-containing protein n=1 Tax=Aeromicrobium sp. PE09-221 TaxID=1898043 RepID=UPI000B3E8CF3|nr:RCC1 domain-containing protein [Aeromicrobium sp. PE09-221]OUZ09116.1 hypothetical protein BHE97_11475 [Aeromicrobium sp. PE09-221]
MTTPAHQTRRTRLRVVLAGLLVSLAVPAGVGTTGAVFTATVSGETQQAGTATLPAVDGAQATRTAGGTAEVSWATPAVRPDVAPDYTIERTIGGDPAPVEGLDLTVDDDGTTGFTDDLTAPAEIDGKPVTAIAAGGVQTCALSETGDAYCWGSNRYGQLGDGTDDASLVPVQVTGLDDPVIAITAGDWHTCALTTTDAGTVYCWGYNGFGQLGDGTTTDSFVPVQVAGLDEPVIAITAGVTHTCALTDTGDVYCWGDNGYGRLGDGTDDASLVPVQVTGLDEPVTAIAAGRTHTCALTDTDDVYCWGDNGYGRLGDGTDDASLVPVQVTGLDKVTAITTGFTHTCALTTTGDAYCWGYGRLGDGTDDASLVPVQVTGLDEPVTAITAGWYHTCALTTTDTAHCWGNNGDGQLGNGTDGASLVPVQVTGLDDPVTAITARVTHTCALTTTGDAYCWGNNVHGQLGNNSTDGSRVPVEVHVAAGGLGRWTCQEENWQLTGDPDDPEPQACAPGPDIPVTYRLAYTKAGWEAPVSTQVEAHMQGNRP